MLDLAKIEAGGFELREAEVDLARLIEEAVRLMTAARANRRVPSWASTIARGLPLALADERALKQIVLNLLSNAVKFTQAGGWVQAFARLEPDGSIAFGVADSGIGIALEDQARVFKSFGQGRHDGGDHRQGNRGSAFPSPKAWRRRMAARSGWKAKSAPGRA